MWKTRRLPVSCLVSLGSPFAKSPSAATLTHNSRRPGSQLKHRFSTSLCGEALECFSAA